MARINSRRKGKRGEKIAREVLTNWTGLEFAGVPASGGLRWKKAENISGDLICTDALHRFDFSIEVKNYADINFEHLLMPGIKSDIMDEFWPQCISDAERGKKIPLLMMRYNGIRPRGLFFIILKKIHYKKFKLLLDLSYPYFLFHQVVIMNSNVLFNTDYKKIKLVTNQIIKETWK